MDDPLTLLRDEFEAAPGSFLLQLRTDLHWDRAAFTRLERALRTTCATHQHHDHVDRWLAAGYHHLSTFVRDWTTHPNFPRPTPPTYHEACLTRPSDLADCFFTATSPYQSHHPWPDL